MVSTIPRPSVFRLPKLPGGSRAVEIPALSERAAGKQPVDEHGLATNIYGDFPREQRRLVAKMLARLGAPKDARPPLGATIAEAIMFGLFLDHGYAWTNAPTLLEHEFRFQSYELGGRQPGGAVTDFYCVTGGARVAVRVQSVYHSLRDPFGGGGQIQAVELRLAKELLASRFIDRVCDVNDPPERALETSTDPQRVHREMLRVEGHLS